MEINEQPAHRERIKIETDEPGAFLILNEDSSGDSYTSIAHSAPEQLRRQIGFAPSARFCGPGGGSRVPHRIRMAIKQLHDAALHPDDNTPLVLIHKGYSVFYLHEDNGKYGLSYSVPSGPDEGPFDTKDEAMEWMADYTQEQRNQIGQGLYLIQCESFFPDTDDCADSIVDHIENQWFDTIVDAESLLNEQLDKMQQATFKDELNNAISAIVRKHLKPVATWQEEHLVTWEMVDEWIEGRSEEKSNG